MCLCLTNGTGCKQILLIDEKNKEAAMALWESIKNMKPSYEALMAWDKPNIRNSAFPKAQILAGNHSMRAMRDAALASTDKLREKDPMLDPEISDPDRWPFFTRVNCTVYYGLTPEQAQVVRFLLCAAAFLCEFVQQHFCGVGLSCSESCAGPNVLCGDVLCVQLSRECNDQIFKRTQLVDVLKASASHWEVCFVSFLCCTVVTVVVGLVCSLIHGMPKHVFLIHGMRKHVFSSPRVLNDDADRRHASPE